MSFTTFLQRFIPNKWFMIAIAIVIVVITIVILFNSEVGGVTWVLSLIIGIILTIGSIVGFFGLRSWEDNPMNPRYQPPPRPVYQPLYQQSPPQPIYQPVYQQQPVYRNY